jgi:hypothetical protein
LIERHPPLSGATALGSPDLTFVATPAAPALGELLQAWQSWPNQHGIPSRDSFDPFDIPSLLPWLSLIEIDRHPNHYRPFDAMYRSIGTSLGEFFQITQRTRQYLSDLGPHIAQRWFPVYDHLFATRHPFAVRGIPYLVGKDYLRFELLMLPLTRGRALPAATQEPVPAAGDIAFAIFAIHVTPNQSDGGDPAGD